MIWWCFEAAVSLRDVARVAKLTAYYQTKLEHRDPTSDSLLLKAWYEIIGIGTLYCNMYNCSREMFLLVLPVFVRCVNIYVTSPNSEKWETWRKTNTGWFNLAGCSVFPYSVRQVRPSVLQAFFVSLCLCYWFRLSSEHRSKLLETIEWEFGRAWTAEKLWLDDGRWRLKAHQ